MVTSVKVDDYVLAQVILNNLFFEWQHVWMQQCSLQGFQNHLQKDQVRILLPEPQSHLSENKVYLNYFPNFPILSKNFLRTAVLCFENI